MDVGVGRAGRREQRLGVQRAVLTDQPATELLLGPGPLTDPGGLIGTADTLLYAAKD